MLLPAHRQKVLHCQHPCVPCAAETPGHACHAPHQPRTRVTAAPASTNPPPHTPCSLPSHTPQVAGRTFMPVDGNPQPGAAEAAGQAKAARKAAPVMETRGSKFCKFQEARIQEMSDGWSFFCGSLWREAGGLCGGALGPTSVWCWGGGIWLPAC